MVIKLRVVLFIDFAPTSELPNRKGFSKSTIGLCYDERNNQSLVRCTWMQSLRGNANGIDDPSVVRCSMAVILYTCKICADACAHGLTKHHCPITGPLNKPIHRF